MSRHRCTPNHRTRSHNTRMIEFGHSVVVSGPAVAAPTVDVGTAGGAEAASARLQSKVSKPTSKTMPLGMPYCPLEVTGSTCAVCKEQPGVSELLVSWLSVAVMLARCSAAHACHAEREALAGGGAGGVVSDAEVVWKLCCRSQAYWQLRHERKSDEAAGE